MKCMGLSAGRSRMRAGTALLCALVLLAACPLLPPEPEASSSVSLRLSTSGLGAPSASILTRSLWPSGDSQLLIPARYRLSASGPMGATLDRWFSDASAIELSGLAPGTWTFQARAVNVYGDEIAVCPPASLILELGAANELSLSLAPDWAGWANGSFRLDLSWNWPFEAQSANNAPATDPHPSVLRLRGLVGDATVPGDEHVMDMYVSASRNGAYGSHSLRPGIWRLDVCLNEYKADLSGQEAVWGLSEIVYVGPSRESALVKALSAAELRQSPVALSPPLSGGTVVADAADLHPSWTGFPGLTPGTRVLYSYDGSDPVCDASGEPASTSTRLLLPGGKIRLGRAEEALFLPAGDKVLRLRWMTWNPWGSTTVQGLDFVVEEALFVDQAATAGADSGSMADPFLAVSSGEERSRALGRDALTEIRVATGSYVQEIYVRDGAWLSGSWTNAAGTWSRDTASLLDPAAYTAANATVFSWGSPGNAVFNVIDVWGLGARVEYLAVEGPTDYSNAAFMVANCGVTVELDHLRITGHTANGSSTALSVVNSPDPDPASHDPVVRIAACLVEGRAMADAPVAGLSTALYADNADLALNSACTLRAGPVPSGGYGYGIRAYGNPGGGYYLDLNDASVTGASAGSAAVNSYGIWATGQAFIDAFQCSIDSGYTDAAGRAVGLSLETAWADLNATTVTSRDACSESIGIYHFDGFGDGWCGLSLASWQQLSVRGGSTVRAGIPGAVPATWTRGIQVLSGRASISGNLLVEAAAAVNDSTAISASLPIDGFWADVSITGNQSIACGNAATGLGAAIRLEGAFRATVSGNKGTSSQPGISGGKGGAAQAGIYVNAPVSIDVYPAGNTLNVSGNWIQGNGQGASAAQSSAGIWMQGRPCSRPILIEGNRVHGGLASDSSLSGIGLAFTEDSGGDLVLRNNIVSAGAFTGTGSGIWRSGIFLSQAAGTSQRVLLLSNTVLGPEAPPTLSVPIPYAAPLYLTAGAATVVYDSLFIARAWNRAALARDSADAAPSVLESCAFFAPPLESSSLWYDDLSDASATDPNDADFFPAAAVDANLSLSVGAVFVTGALPSGGASSFFSFDFALSDALALADQGLWGGGMDLSASATGNAAASPWWFSTDASGAARSAPWSIGAMEH